MAKACDVALAPTWAELSQDQRWHYRHREWNTARTLERRQRLRRWLHRQKAASDGCVRCGESDPACLDFHHCAGIETEMDVNKMVPWGYSKADIRAEIETCELLCANCHRQEHHSQPAWLVDLSIDRDRTKLTDIGDGEAQVSRLRAMGLTKEEALRVWTRDYKRERGCRSCDNGDPVCLQFHHVGEKTGGIGAMIADSVPVEMVVADVENCVVLCANCHRTEHYQGPESPD